MRLFESKKKKRTISRTEALESTPVKNLQVSEQRLDNGDLLLSYPLVLKPWLHEIGKRFFKSDQQKLIRKIQLDKLGTEVWDLMDGKSTVQNIIHHFAKNHQLHPKEAEVSVTQFLRNLGKKGLIGIE